MSCVFVGIKPSLSINHVEEVKIAINVWTKILPLMSYKIFAIFLQLTMCLHCSSVASTVNNQKLQHKLAITASGWEGLQTYLWIVNGNWKNVAETSLRLQLGWKRTAKFISFLIKDDRFILFYVIILPINMASGTLNTLSEVVDRIWVRLRNFHFLSIICVLDEFMREKKRVVIILLPYFVVQGLCAWEKILE